MSPARTVAELIRRNAADGTIAAKPMLLFEDRAWTHAEYLDECLRFAAVIEGALPAGRPPHVGVLMDNTPDFVFAMGGAALCGAVVVALNTTLRGEHLLAEMTSSDVGMLIVEAKFAELVTEIRGELSLAPDAVLVTTRFSTAADVAGATGYGDLDEQLVSAATREPPTTAPMPDDMLLLTFTSGTVGLPKAIPWTHERVVGTSELVVGAAGLTTDDVAYLAMPLFHANAVVCNWGPVLVLGATTAMARRFSASRWLDDVRRYHATYANYVGKPLTYILATPRRDDDADNPLRVMFGNEGASPRLTEFAERFGVKLIDTYGTSEGGIAILRDATTPAYALGPVPDGVKVVDDDGREMPRAKFDDTGALANAEECVGHLVQTHPLSNETFAGYYNNDTATADYTRHGWLWTGDLAYIDDDGYIYFAGRTQEWIRVDGENFIGTPIEEILTRHPDVILASVYGVPDAEAGDQVMACVSTADPEHFDVATFARWIDAQPDLSRRWRPRYLRITAQLPLNGVNKVLKRVLISERFRLDRVGADAIYEWPRGEAVPTPFGPAEEARLRADFRRNDRDRFWDL